MSDLPAVTSGQVRAYLGSPLVAASGHVVGALTVYDPEPRQWTDDETELLRAAGRLRGGRARALGRPLRGGDVGHAAERGSGGQLDRHLGTRPAHRCHRHGRALRGALRPRRRHALRGGRRHADAVRAPGRRRRPCRRPCSGRCSTTASSPPSSGRSGSTAPCAGWWPGAGSSIDTRGEPVRLLGTVVDVTDTRRQAAQRLSAMHRATAIAEVAAELANAAQHGEPARDRAARSPGARCPGQRDGRLRPRERTAAAAHDQRAHRRGAGARRLLGPRSRDRARRHAGDPVRGHARPPRAARRPRGGPRPVPGHARGPRSTRIPRGGRAAAARRGADPGRVRGPLDDRAPVLHRRRRGAGSARRPDRAERLAAAGRRRARSRRRRDA